MIKNFKKKKTKLQNETWVSLVLDLGYNPNPNLFECECMMCYPWRQKSAAMCTSTAQQVMAQHALNRTSSLFDLMCCTINGIALKVFNLEKRNGYSEKGFFNKYD